MPQVPYSPVPDIAPTGPAVGPVRIETPPAAFGITEAAAVRGLGQQVEQSSDQMFNTALYVKQLDNETWAKNEFVNQSAKLGQIESDFYGLKGQAATAAMPKYSQDVRSLYENAIANAPNPQAARFLGDSLSRRISYSLVDGQRHAGQQRLAAAGDASVSTSAAAIDTASRHPFDNDIFNDSLKTLEAEAATQESLGMGKAQANLLKAKNVLWEERFSSLYGNPAAAQTLYDKHQDEIPPLARKNIQQQIRSSESTVRFNQAYATNQAKADAEANVSQISSQNRTVDSVTGQPGYGPNIVKQLTDYARGNPAADKEVQERLNWVQRANDRAAKGLEVQTNWEAPQVVALKDNMFNPDRKTTERDIAKAENDGVLGGKDGGRYLNIIKMRDAGDAAALKDPLFKAASDWAKTMIDGSTAGSRFMNAGAYAGFQFKFLSEYLKAQRDGKLEPGDLNVRNPDSMVRKIADEFIPPIGKAIMNNGGVGAPAPAVPAPAQGTQQNPYTISTKAERDALPDGVWYTRPDQPGALFPKGKPKKPEAAM